MKEWCHSICNVNHVTVMVGPLILSTFDFLTTVLPFPLVHGACESLGMRILYYKDSGVDRLFGFKFVISQLIGGFLLTSPNKPMRNVLWPKFQPYIYWLYHTLDFNGVQYSYLWAYTSQSGQKTVQLRSTTDKQLSVGRDIWWKFLIGTFSNGRFNVAEVTKLKL